MRALGVMERARRINAKEFMQRWSCLRLASCMKLIPIPLDTVDGMLTAAQPASIQQAAGESLTDEQRDIRRASLIQTMIKV